MTTATMRHVWRQLPANLATGCPFGGLGARALLGRRRVHGSTTGAGDDDEADRAATRSAARARSPPLIYPEPRGAAKHHDLPSFLQHAERSGLNPAATTFVGTHYEYTVAACLRQFGFELRRVGGASDNGTDLLGVWTLPLPPRDSGAADPIRVIVQCKAGAGQRIGPSLVRELEGAFVGAPVGWRSRAGLDNSSSGDSDQENSPAVIGLLVAEKPATKGIRDALTRSRWPLAFVYCSGTGSIHQMLWNQRAEQEGSLAGLGVTLRHNNANAGSGNPTQIVLTWQGMPLPPVPEDDT